MKAINHQITVSMSAFHDIGNSENILIGYYHIQSTKRKEYILYDYMEKQQINRLVVTETWLKDNKESDKIWMDCSLFNSGDGYKISAMNRPGIKKGGGLVLIYRNNTEMSVEDGTGDGQRSFEYSIWK